MRIPNPLRFLKALFYSLYARWRGFRILTTEEERDDRLFSCELCGSLDPRVRQCNDCTCFVDAKAALTMEECPRGYWLRIYQKRVDEKQ